ncbi:hypothetical protein OHA70_21880 [Kribbella sp. NBC_00382]|uniref:hypothetical protein n=1 Tax=Kribbella sp. NBC_00382 TaxID=2975967 RepID=UPI002E1BBC61
MTGTTTFGAEALADLFIAHQAPEGGVLELPGMLIAEPENPADASAVAVHVQGARIGYLPGYLAQEEPFDDVGSCRVQLWAAQTDKGLRVRGWAAWGGETIAWPYTTSNPPAVTVEDRRVEAAAATSTMVDEALRGGGERAAQFQRGLLGSYHYLETVEPIKELKRLGRLDEALTLCYGAIEAA